VATIDPQLDQLCVNTIRALSIDAIQKANSGHPACHWALRPWLLRSGPASSNTAPLILTGRS